jgi:fermentation-respiration switch protein FrsA (DUF1100 family)
MLEAAGRILLGLLVGYVLISLAACALQDSLLYFPDTSRPDPARFGVPDMAPVELRTADGLALLAWYKPGDPTLVLLHGNGGHIGHRGFKVRPWLDAGVGVLLVEWRGYGGNPGKPGEAGFRDDGRAALDFLAARGVAPERVVLYGESLGTGIAVMLAAERPIGALVLEAPYDSIAALAAWHYPFLPVNLLIRDRYDAGAAAPKVKAPVLAVHGEADDIVPPRFGQALHDALPPPKQRMLVPRAGHNDLDRFGLDRVVLEFLAAYPKRRP